ncbi:MAG TPA: Holliday junction resolvase RecU, partial [Anaerolineales bacterium]
LLAWQHNIYLSNRRALIWFTGTQGKVRRGKVILLKSRPDFEGVLCTLGGRHVALDAKVTASVLYRHDHKRLHQLRDLWEVHEAGGVAFLLISHQLERFYSVWPQPSWAYREPFSIRLDQLDGRGVEVVRAGSNRLPDWLSTIEEVYR